jgi:hypothetical protein
MNKLVNKFIVSSALIVLLPSISATAQQLPNVGFNEWKDACGYTRALSGSNASTDNSLQRPGVEPASWNGSNVNQKVSGVSATSDALVTKGTDGDNAYVSLVNTKVGVKIGLWTIGSVSPGYITFGTPWVYATTTLSSCDGGTYGGVDFTYRPESIRMKVKRTDSNSEESYVLVYLWNGTFTSKIGVNGSPTVSVNNADRAIMGYATDAVTGDGKLVASVATSFTPSERNVWETLTFPLSYEANAGEPTMMNVVVCSGAYRDRSALVEGTTLLVDDVEFVYPTTEYVGRTHVDANTKDDRSIRARSASTWSNDATLTITDYGNLVSADPQGNRTTTGKVSLPVEGIGTLELDGVELVHYDDYTWINSTEQTVTVNGETANVTIEGSLSNDGSYRVYSEVTPASTGTPSLVSFLDATAVTTGITDIADSSTKVSVFGGQGYLHIAGVAGTVNVYSLTGALIATATIDGEGSIELPAGTVIVATPAGAVKTIIR